MSTDHGPARETAPEPENEAVTAPAPSEPVAGPESEDSRPAPSPAVTVALPEAQTLAEAPQAPGARAQVVVEAKEALSSIGSGVASLLSALFSFVLSVFPFVKRKAFRHGFAALVWAAAFGCSWYAFGFWGALIGCLVLYGATSLHLWSPSEDA